MIDLKEVKERNDLMINEYSNDSIYLRYIHIDDEILLRSKDCALLLEYKKYQNAIKRHILDSDKIKLRPKNISKNSKIKINNAGELFITENAFNYLLISSNMKICKYLRKYNFSSGIIDILKQRD